MNHEKNKTIFLHEEAAGAMEQHFFFKTRKTSGLENGWDSSVVILNLCHMLSVSQVMISVMVFFFVFF